MGGHENTIIAERSSKMTENNLKEYMQIKVLKQTRPVIHYLIEPQPPVL